ncbi:MAG: 2OG-Fe(II) oxygenase [Paenibacillus polymyxa]
MDLLAEFSDGVTKVNILTLIKACARVGLTTRVLQLNGNAPCTPGILHHTENRFTALLWPGPPAVVFNPLNGVTECVESLEPISDYDYFISITCAFPRKEIFLREPYNNFRMWKHQDDSQSKQHHVSYFEPPKYTDHVMHPERLKEIYRIGMNYPSDKEVNYRTLELHRGNRNFVSARDIEAYILVWCKNYNTVIEIEDKNKRIESHIVLLADLNMIHPFIDGNGRLVTTLCDYAEKDFGYKVNLRDIPKGLRYIVSWAYGIGSHTLWKQAIKTCIEGNASFVSCYNKSWYLTRPPAIDILGTQNCKVIRVRNFLPVDKGSKLLQMAGSKENLAVRSSVVGYDRDNKNRPFRSSKTIFDVKDMVSDISYELQNMIHSAAAVLGIYLPCDYSIEAQVTFTGQGGYFLTHSDNSGDEVSDRILTFVIYLSDETSFQGGDLEFFEGFDPHLKIGTLSTLRLQPVARSAVFFEPRLYHQVQPVIASTNDAKRITLNGWVRPKI